MTESTADPTIEKRQCGTCHAMKDLTDENFTVRTYPDGKQSFRGQCRLCRNKYAKIGVPEPIRQETTKKATGLCSVCCGMSHRVPAIKCPGCGLCHKAEEPPKVELFARNFDRAM